jgi:hypothetical protein
VKRHRFLFLRCQRIPDKDQSNAAFNSLRPHAFPGYTDFSGRILVRCMKARAIAALVWLVTLAVCAASEPDRAKGLSVHMLPDRVAQIDRGHGGFTARDASGAESSYVDAKQLVAFFQTLPAPTQENGIWVVTTHPSAYSDSERAKLKALIALCDEKKIPVFTCRGSELPSGWKRSGVPTGWNNSNETH